MTAGKWILGTTIVLSLGVPPLAYETMRAPTLHGALEVDTSGTFPAHEILTSANDCPLGCGGGAGVNLPIAGMSMDCKRDCYDCDGRCVAALGCSPPMPRHKPRAPK